METPAVKNNEQQLAIENQKREAWGKMGVIIYRKELELQVQAQASLAKLENPPATIEEIPAAEMALKEVKADQAKLTEDRKAITSKFDDVTKRLMEAEKSFAIPLTDFANAIIKVKKEHERIEAEKRLKVTETNRIRQQLSILAADTDAKFKRLVGEKVTVAYEFALNRAVEPDKKDDYLNKVCAQVTEKLFTVDFPNPQRAYVTDDELGTIVSEVFKINPADYVALFAVEIEERFSDYDVAFSKKEQALKLAKEEQERKEQEIKEQQQNQTLAAELEASSTDYSVEPAGFKALKKCYEVDMPETFENAMKILSAFMANKALCQPKTTVKKWFGFSADSAAKALAKVKSEDNNFAPAGISFKEVDKL